MKQLRMLIYCCLLSLGGVVLFAAPLLALAGLTYIVRRNASKSGSDKDGGES